MRRLHSIKTALETLSSHPLRTTLSTLGVIIGVASLVAILALADGLEAYARVQIAETTDLHGIMVVPVTEEVRDGIRIRRDRIADFTDDDVAALRDALGDDADMTLTITGSGRAHVPGDTTVRGVLLAAVQPDARLVRPEQLLAGRYIEDHDMAGDSAVVVVPSAAAAWLGRDPSALVGRELIVDSSAHRIIGVVREEAEAIRLRIPLGVAARAHLERPDRRVLLALRARNVEAVEPIRERVEQILAERHADVGGAAAFRASSNRARATQAREAFLLFRLVMGAIGGISLLVGGIGIMNILLASVFERTREIGIRRAAGARASDIRRQFLAEAIVISGAGAALGVLLGLGGAFGITAAIRQLSDANIYAGFAWSSILVAAGAALIVGLAFGTYPARRAAGLSPIEAIRHE
ncbi:MAG TPA: ABC transporter permease [Longimicrobiales bacterium]